MIHSIDRKCKQKIENSCTISSFYRINSSKNNKISIRNVSHIVGSHMSKTRLSGLRLRLVFGVVSSMSGSSPQLGHLLLLSSFLISFLTVGSSRSRYTLFSDRFIHSKNNSTKILCVPHILTA